MEREAIFYNATNIALQSQYKELKKLKDTYGSWEKAWATVSQTTDPKIDPEKNAAALETAGVELILFDEDRYPALLTETSLPPLGLYIKGTLPPLEYPVGIVGTRKATTEGKELAREFGKVLAEAGCVVISGLALGVDAAGHRGALEGHGITVAVLANGLDHIYPATNARLAEDILKDGGALISEYPLGSPSLPYRFLERNRIISGLSRGILIIEAPARSGTIATARFALEENRDVFVLPGPARHPNFAGSHELLKQGASLVTVPEDILQAFGLETKKRMENADISPEETAILDILRQSTTPLAIDKIIELSHLQAPMANQLVSFLITKGLIEETEFGYTTIQS